MNDIQPFVYEVKLKIMDESIIPATTERMHTDRKDAFDYMKTLAKQMGNDVQNDISGSMQTYNDKDIPLRYKGKSCVYFMQGSQRCVLYIKTHTLY